MKIFPIEKYRYYFYSTKDADGNEVKCVKAVSTYAGKLVNGIAKCHPNDVYDEEIGKKIAAHKCGAKIAEKRLKRAQRRMDEIILMDEDFRKFKLDAAAYYANAAEEYRHYFPESK